MQAIYPPIPNPEQLKEKRMNNVVAYARKVEGDMYETAGSRVRIITINYFKIVLMSIYKINIILVVKILD